MTFLLLRRGMSRAGLPVALVASILWAGLPPALAQAAPELDPDTGLPKVAQFEMPASPPVEPFWAERKTGYLTTADGTRLRYSALLPARREGARVPVILFVNGYDAGSIGGAAYRRGQTAQMLPLDRRLLEAGYAVMGVNPAGTGCSTGMVEYTRPQLGRHGAEAVEFAAAQPWSDGRIGMMGWSYGGSSQLAAAQFQPPHLRAIVPGVPLMDYRDALAPGGVTQPGFVTNFRVAFRAWWETTVQRTAREEGDTDCVAQVARNLEQEETHSIMQLVVAHPLRDDYMNSFDLAAGVDRIRVPVLSAEAFQDQALTSRGNHYHARLEPSRLWRVQSNGGHDIYAAPAFLATAMRFIDRYVKDVDNGFERDTPRLSIWMETTGPELNGLRRAATARAGWSIDRAAVHDADLRVREFHLAGGGLLSDRPGDGAADGYDYPGGGVAVNDVVGRSFWGALPADWSTTSLAYTSAPLEADTMLYGTGSADLWVAVNGGDADLQVTLTELRPDGQETYVQRGWLRLSNRALDPARSTPLLPWHTERPESFVPLLPNRPALARVELQRMGHYLRQGSRLRLWIDTPAQSGGLVFAPISLRQRVRVLHTARHDSVLRLGTLPGVRGPVERPACGTLLLQPCRPDPLAAR
ncbi:CocE/NonD family hydrolase [Roseateles chitosanitabidus]|uniref:CocE/NonD family hydrolase n=1 Tax=Roseateles chitosanitabidus TaxID=65048 RepID=UPI002357396D|nr:CocE/NonD family hydrolase [Roseateles chitosanitabidus]